ncbi:cobalamin biosynthesis protein [Rhizobium sullae]|uniref:Cobalt-precorrin 5A hydrolase/precorrin-3B C17-methyltransferase n=1 Tax=Rhizobium sullae TaxID=50338 RepID=A0A4R3PXI3_RHISU|nr:cobalamin biosynthesis protein [Rhizobium sullae]TCU12949.1 cobalt-precorrin 5A hydrolase/precorrin-3B C17-methyltransferase [Rhizobium sullae]
MTEITFDISRRHVLGLGCERGTPADEVMALAGEALRLAGLAPGELAAIASIDGRAGEPAILEAARHFSLPMLFFSAARLEEETPRLKNPSDIVFARIGCHGVAESAALAGAGQVAELAVPKIKSAHATAAIARMRLQKE